MVVDRKRHLHSNFLLIETYFTLPSLSFNNGSNHNINAKIYSCFSECDCETDTLSTDAGITVTLRSNKMLEGHRDYSDSSECVERPRFRSLSLSLR